MDETNRSEILVVVAPSFFDSSITKAVFNLPKSPLVRL